MTTTFKGSKPGLKQCHDTDTNLPPLVQRDFSSSDASEQTLTEKEYLPRALDDGKSEAFPQGANALCPPSSVPEGPKNTPGDEVTYPEGGLQAWLVVLGSFCAMLAAFGMMNTSTSATICSIYHGLVR